MSQITVPCWQKVTMTAEEASSYSSIGINRIRTMLADPRCSFALHVGEKKTLVKRREFEQFLSKSIEI